VAAALRHRGRSLAEAAVITRNSDDWTIDHWRLEPHFSVFELEDPPERDQAPTLWKDLMMASVVALVLWVIAAVVFG
jgi:hypothetical protein